MKCHALHSWPGFPLIPTKDQSHYPIPDSVNLLEDIRKRFIPYLYIRIERFDQLQHVRMVPNVHSKGGCAY